MRKMTVVANWKMYTNLAEAEVLARMIAKGAAKLPAVEVVLCVPSIWLLPVREAIGNHPVRVGSQNMHWETEGAYTGEISAAMLKGIAKNVLIGHSERRRYFGEDNHTVHAKILTALSYHLIPIVCVGEEEALNFKGADEAKVEEKFKESVLAEQIRQTLRGLGEEMEKIIIAYEPVWAIGAAEPAGGGYTNLVAGLIRRQLARMANREVAERVRILYGGSIDGKNAPEILWQPEIDGVLAGRASLKASAFLKICEVASQSPRIKGL